MQKRWIFTLVMMLILLLAVPTTEAATIHLTFALSADIRLDSQQKYQLFSFSPLQDETWTIVAYGLDENVTPTLTLLSADGTTLQEDLNSESSPVAYISAPIELTGMHIFMVSYAGENSGLIRVMVFEGAPLDEDITLLDTAFPTEPSRAFLVAGDPINPVAMGFETLPPANDPAIVPQAYASRGDSTAVPALEERTTPVERIAWVNDKGETFYTLNVSPLPEATAYKTDGLLAFAHQFTGTFDFLVKIRAGSEIPVRVERPACTETIVSTAGTLRAGPGDTYRPTGQLGAGTIIEITGTDQSGDWLQIVDPHRPVGNSWIPNQQTYDLTRPDCVRVESVYAPPLNNSAISTLSQDNLIVSLDFSCNQTDAFAAAYAAIQAQLGFLLPDLEFVLGQLQAVSCTTSSADSTPGSLPNLGGNSNTSPDGGGAAPQICPDGTSSSTIVLYDSPYGTANQPAGENNYTGGADCENVYANANPNTIDTGDGNDFILTYGGNDTIYAGAGNDTINAGDGDDWIRGGEGDDLVDGGNGNDTYDASDNPNTVFVSLPQGQAISSIDILVNIENVNTGSGNDTIIGDDNDNILNGNAGDDSIYGGFGNDIIIGGDGNDTLYTDPGIDNIDAGNGDDTIVIEGNHDPADFITGGSGVNIFRFLAGTSGSLIINSMGTDTLDFSLFGMPISINLNTATQTIGGLTLTLPNPVSNIIGTPFDDTLIGNSADNEIHGLDGNDNIDAGAGTDTIYGGSGSDTIEGNEGDDILYGGWDNSGGENRDDIGNDLITDNSISFDFIHGGNNNYGGSGNDGDDTIIDNGGDFDAVWGGNLNIFGTGNDGNDIITVTGGNVDFVFGGNDNYGYGVGDDGNDTITVNGGSLHVIAGGNGNGNQSVGNDGSDTITSTGSNELIVGGNINATSGGAIQAFGNGTGDDNIDGGTDSINAADSDNNDNVYGDNDNFDYGSGAGAGIGSSADSISCDPLEATCNQGSNP